MKHVGIAEDFRVVEIDKVKLPDLDIHEERSDEKAQADPQVVARNRRRPSAGSLRAVRGFSTSWMAEGGPYAQRPSSGASAADRKQLGKTR